MVGLDATGGLAGGAGRGGAAGQAAKAGTNTSGAGGPERHAAGLTRNSIVAETRRRIHGMVLTQINQSVRKELAELSLITFLILQGDPVVVPKLCIPLNRLWDGLR